VWVLGARRRGPSPAGPPRLLLEVRARSPHWQLAALQLCCQPRKGAETLALCVRAERKACACRSSCAGGVQRLEPVRGGSSAPPAARVRVTARVCGARSSIARSARAGSSRSCGLSGRSARQSSSARRPELRRQIDRNAKPAGVLWPGQALHTRRRIGRDSVDVRKAGTGRGGSARIGRARMREWGGVSRRPPPVRLYSFATSSVGSRVSRCDPS
jgi:hypothetical protein